MIQHAPRAGKPSLFPRQLAERGQWVNWRVEARAGKPTKVPYQPNGRAAKTNDPSTWSALAEVLAVASRFAGIGYVFSADDPFAGIDLDGCRDPQTGALATWATAAISLLDTYAEISPSGSGIKLFLRGSIPEGFGNKWKVPGADAMGGKTAGIEIYDRLRFFVVTGQRLPGHAEPQERQQQLERLLTLAPPKPQRPVRQAPTTTRPADTSIIERGARYLDRVPGAVSGQHGHDATFRAACALVLGFGLSPENAWPLLRSWNAKCDPPWGEHELFRKLVEADKQADQRGYLLRSAGNGCLPKTRPRKVYVA